MFVIRHLILNDDDLPIYYLLWLFKLYTERWLLGDFKDMFDVIEHIDAFSPDCGPITPVPLVLF